MHFCFWVFLSFLGTNSRMPQPSRKAVRIENVIAKCKGSGIYGQLSANKCGKFENYGWWQQHSSPMSTSPIIKWNDVTHWWESYVISLHIIKRTLRWSPLCALSSVYITKSNDASQTWRSNGTPMSASTSLLSTSRWSPLNSPHHPGWESLSSSHISKWCEWAYVSKPMGWSSSQSKWDSMSSLSFRLCWISLLFLFLVDVMQMM